MWGYGNRRKEYPPIFKSLNDLLGNPELSWFQKEFGSDLKLWGSPG